MQTTFTANNLQGGSLQNISTTFGAATGSGATITGATGRRNQVIDFSFGPGSPPNATDCTILYDVSRCTTVGTGTAVTPVPNDGVAAAASTVATVNQTAAPTVTAASSMYCNGFSQRASQRIVLREDEFMIGPATAAAGTAYRGQSATYAGSIIWDVKFQDIN